MRRPTKGLTPPDVRPQHVDALPPGERAQQGPLLLSAPTALMRSARASGLDGAVAVGDGEGKARGAAITSQGRKGKTIAPADGDRPARAGGSLWVGFGHQRATEGSIHRAVRGSLSVAAQE